MFKEKIKNKALIKNKQKKFIDFFKEKEQNIGNYENLQTPKVALKLRKDSKKFVKNGFRNLDKWEIRDIIYQSFEILQENSNNQDLKKDIFLIFTDVLNEVRPETSPLIFKYGDELIVKKHLLFIDFNLINEVIQKIASFDDYLRHQLIFEIFRKDEIYINGTPKYLGNLNFLILNVLDKILYEELIPFDMIVSKQNGNSSDFNFSINLDYIEIALKGIFEALESHFLNKKHKLKQSLIKTDNNTYLIKIKDFVKNLLKDKEELEYLKQVANIEEQNYGTILLELRNYETQKNLFNETIKREEESNTEKIEGLFLILGITNINPVLLLKYFDTDDILYSIHSILRNLQDEGLLTDKLKNGVKLFLKKLFQYPYLSYGYLNKNILDKTFRVLFPDEKELYLDYLYFTRRYKEFLENFKDIKLIPQYQLKQLLAKYYTKEFNKDELLSWLILIPLNEAYFIFHLLKGTLDILPQNNEYRYIAEAYNVNIPVEHIKENISEEGYYTLILRLLGYYPYDKTLENLLYI